MIRTTIRNAIRDSPPVLINANSGRLCNKLEQIAAFESMPIFTELVCSMTTDISRSVIEEEVGKFYRYVTFSHTWEGDEPPYEKVVKIVVYDLEASPTHDKLQMFCKIVRDEGLNWAWSDTCCIDKGNHFILQEALVRMFKWYEGSAMTIIFLYDVGRLAELGALTMSKWNSRGWTLQEYHASQVVRIYTKDWTPYLGLTTPNHKESPQIILEMEKATDISAQALKALRPGLSDIREKLRLASTRQTTRVEDAAYSLLGIFSATLPVTYGEGDMALGRLLSQLLMSSGATSILAWSGRSGSFNSCLPKDIVVFSQPLASYIPTTILDVAAGTGRITTGRHASSQLTRLYDRVVDLPKPDFAGQRMKLPCLAFKIGPVLPPSGDGSDIVFRVQTSAFGVVDIKTDQDLSRRDSLYLVHPWIDFLLDRQSVRGTVETTPGPGPLQITSPAPQMHWALFSAIRRMFGRRPTEKWMRILQFIARLQQPFGALLLESNQRNEYTRIATESVITVQITPTTLDELIQGVQVLDVL